MPLYVNVSGTNKAVIAVYTKVGGAWKSVSTMYTKVAGAWKVGFAPNYTVSLDQSSVSGGCLDPLFCVATSDPVTATPTGGGVEPFTYLWEFVSGDAAAVPVSPTSATTTFSVGSATPSTVDAVYRCKVTDDIGTIKYSGNVSVHLEFQVI